MNDINRLFLRMLDLMTSSVISDGFRWYIQSIDMLPEGPCAIFYFDWKNPPLGYMAPSATSHDSFACMSMRMEGGKPVLRPETCSLGKLTTDASQALHNRFKRAYKTVMA